MDGTFPNYRELVPTSYTSRVTLHAEELLRGVCQADSYRWGDVGIGQGDEGCIGRFAPAKSVALPMTRIGCKDIVIAKRKRNNPASRR